MVRKVACQMLITVRTGTLQYFWSQEDRN